MRLRRGADGRHEGHGRRSCGARRGRRCGGVFEEHRIPGERGCGGEVGTAGREKERSAATGRRESGRGVDRSARHWTVGAIVCGGVAKPRARRVGAARRGRSGRGRAGRRKHPERLDFERWGGFELVRTGAVGRDIGSLGRATETSIAASLGAAPLAGPQSFTAVLTPALQTRLATGVAAQFKSALEAEFITRALNDWSQRLGCVAAIICAASADSAR
mmetsp:Transcript_2773/g.7617  ORF Transcript_2773/g.7617 Transcript_2773/m.7617 type:complete len:218 (-) Transcript_2773:2316-2969(-)